MFCTQCGAKAEEGSQYCIQCGARLPVEKAVSERSSAVYGTPASQGFQKTSVAPDWHAQGNASSPATAQPSDQSKLVPVIVIAVVLVCAIAVILLSMRPSGQVGDGAGSASSAAAEQSQGSNADEGTILKRLSAYGRVLKERMDAYGRAELVEVDDQTVALNGVALATLRDFNKDGNEELLIAYYDSEKDADAYPLRANDSYQVEVWACDEEEATLVHNQAAENSNGGELYVTVFENASESKDGTGDLLVQTEYPDGTIFNSVTTYYGFDGNGFVPVKTYEVSAGQSGDAGGAVYKIDGESVDKETYEQQAASAQTGDAEVYKLLEFEGGSSQEALSVEEVKNLTEETVSTIEQASAAEASSAGSADADEDSETNAGESAASDVGAIEKEEPEEDVLAKSAFAGFPRKFLFSSGVGGWSTSMRVNKDGTFTGGFHDINMGENGPDYPGGTLYACEFEGKFSVVNKVSDTEYELQLDYLKPTHKAETVYDDDRRIIWMDDQANGLGEMTKEPVGGWRLYLPDHANKGFPKAVTLMWRTEGWDENTKRLNGYGLVGGGTDNSSDSAWFSA